MYLTTLVSCEWFGIVSLFEGAVSSDLSHIRRVVDRFEGHSPLPTGVSGPTEDPITFCFVHDVAP